MIYDFCIIGAGISGTTIAKKLSEQFPTHRCIIFDKETEPGGIWFQTKWSWLCSDTKTYNYCPGDRSGIKMLKNYFLKGNPCNEILRVVNENIKYVERRQNTTVFKVSLDTTHEQNIWNIDTNQGLFQSKWIINCSGLYQHSYIPEDLEKFCINNNVPYVHSKYYSDDKTYEKIAVIVSRESGAQIVRGLSKKQKIDWYGRSFGNWYINSIKSTTLDKVLYYLFMIPFIGVYLLPIITWARKFILNKAQAYIIKQIGNKNVRLNECFYKINTLLRYDYKQPIRPVFISDIHFENVSINMLSSDLNCLTNYDLVVFATGYDMNKPNFEIVVDDKQMNVDMFNLVNYVKPSNIPNMLFLFPLSVSSWITLEKQSEVIIKVLQKYSDDNYMVSKEESVTFEKKVNDFLSENQISRQELMYHQRAPTLIDLDMFYY